MLDGKTQKNRDRFEIYFYGGDETKLAKILFFQFIIDTFIGRYTAHFSSFVVMQIFRIFLITKKNMKIMYQIIINFIVLNVAIIIVTYHMQFHLIGQDNLVAHHTFLTSICILRLRCIEIDPVYMFVLGLNVNKLLMSRYIQ